MWPTIIKPVCKDGGILAVKLGKLTEEEARLLQTQQPTIPQPTIPKPTDPTVKFELPKMPTFPPVDLVVFADHSTGKYGYRNSAGAIVIPAQYKYAERFNGKIAAVQNDAGKTGFIDANNQVRIPFRYNEILTRTSVARYLFYRNNDYVGMMDENGKVLVPDNKYTGITAHWNPKIKQIIASIGSLDGMIDENGNVLLPVKFEGGVRDFDEADF